MKAIFTEPVLKCDFLYFFLFFLTKFYNFTNWKHFWQSGNKPSLLWVERHSWFQRQEETPQDIFQSNYVKVENVILGSWFCKIISNVKRGSCNKEDVAALGIGWTSCPPVRNFVIYHKSTGQKCHSRSPTKRNVRYIYKLKKNVKKHICVLDQNW